MKTVLVVPYDWIDISKSQEKRLKKIQPFSLCTHSFSKEKGSKKSSVNCIKGVIISDFELALWVLPKSMANGKNVKKWPRIIDTKSDSNTLHAICFADTIEELILFLDKKKKTIAKQQKTFVTCQYEHPYTAMLEKWAKAGAQALHPGEYFKDDFLQALTKMDGQWVYFGHALDDRLRGYGHLLYNELCTSKPLKPLSATLWFTCSTLSAKGQKNVALRWFLSGATHCLLASSEAVKTEANQELGNAWLVLAQKKKQLSVAEILLELANNSKDCKNTLGQYCLLGNPYVLGSLV